jgi:hypothetical protein
LSIQRGRRPFMLSMVLAGLAAAIIGPAPAAAGNSVFSTVSVELSDNQAWGWGPPSTNLKITLRGSEGEYQGHFNVTSEADGYWEGRFWGTVDAGDRVTAAESDGSPSRTYTVQPLSLSINRVTDVVSGRSVPNSHVSLEVYGCQSQSCNRNVDTSRATNGLGNFSLDTTSQYNIRGRDFVSAAWYSTQGDEQFYSLGAPSLTAWVGHNEAWGTARPRQDMAVWLFNSQGTQKAKFKDRASPWDGDFDGLFSANNRAVNIRPGDYVDSNFAGDVQFQIIASNPAFNTGADTMSGKCFKNKLVMVSGHHEDFSARVEAEAMANSNGNFSIDLMAADGYDLQSGDTIEIECRNAKGDSQLTTFEVP